jgi:hypothetical protein
MRSMGANLWEALLSCHPEPEKRGEGPHSCHRRFHRARAPGLQLRGPSPSAGLRMTIIAVAEVAS